MPLMLHEAELSDIGARLRPPHFGTTQQSERAVFCSRSLDLHSIRVVGYDMDYTLVNYHESVWEARACNPSTN